jgi:hypothetical protein
MGLMNLSNESVTVLLECGLETISVWDTVQYTALAPGNDGKAVDERTGNGYCQIYGRAKLRKCITGFRQTESTKGKRLIHTKKSPIVYLIQVTIGLLSFIRED